MRFFDTNWLFNRLDGTITASSGSPEFAFDEDNQFAWNSAGQGTDGDVITITRTLTQLQPIDAIFIKNTNINNITIEVDVGAGLVPLSNFTLIKSLDGINYYYSLDSQITIQEIKITGSNTITPNQQKTIGQILSFRELGQIKNINSIDPKLKKIQKVNKLISGKKDIINKGREFDSISLGFKTHYRADDNAIIQTILDRDDSFWLWINDNSEDVQVMALDPFRFGDIQKVAVMRDYKVKYTKNLFFSGMDLKLKLTEVV
jgi:hypothetical protein